MAQVKLKQEMTMQPISLSPDILVNDVIDLNFPVRERGIGNAIYPPMIKYITVNGRMAVIKGAGPYGRPAMSRCIKETR